MINLNLNARIVRSKYARAQIYFKTNEKCYLCGEELDLDWQVDHFIPWCKGGKTTEQNVNPVCKICNLKKGSKIMSSSFSAWDYEKMSWFAEDFPDAANIRVCQIGAYNCIVQKLILEKSKSCSISLPTGSGKSLLIRAAAIGLCKRRSEFAGVWVFSPSTALRNQLKSDEIQETFNRLGCNFSFNPFMEIDSLDGPRFRNDCLLESFTIQYLTSNGNVNLFIEHARRIYRKTGKYPVAIFDESHLFSTDNTWGMMAQALQKEGLPIVLVTGTPFRSDNIAIPGFKTELSETVIRKFTKSKKISDDPLVLSVRKGLQEVCKYILIADYEYTYERAWQDDVILKPEPTFIDATDILADQLLSEMPKGNTRILRSFLMDDRTVKAAVKDCVESIRLRKKADASCAAIVTTLSDEEGAEDDLYADIHAKKIEREFKRQAPDLKTLVVTSNSNSDETTDGLTRFKTHKYDVLIVKAMGTIGYNCPRIKTVLNLSNHRTLTAFWQLVNRGSRKFGGIFSYDVIMPKDKGMKELWEDFIACSGLEIEVKTTLEETEEEVEIEPTEPTTPDLSMFVKHTSNFDPHAQRSEQDEIDEMFKAKLPEIANRMERQERLSHYTLLAATLGEDWLEKLVVQPPASILIDCNEEESRLRQDAVSTVKEITTEVFSILGIKYEKKYQQLYGNIHKNIWTKIKRDCGFRPNQSLDNICGIDNFKAVIKAGNQLKSDLLRVSDDTNFDWERWLKK